MSSAALKRERLVFAKRCRGNQHPSLSSLLKITPDSNASDILTLHHFIFTACKNKWLALLFPKFRLENYTNNQMYLLNIQRVLYHPRHYTKTDKEHMPATTGISLLKTLQHGFRIQCLLRDTDLSAERKWKLY
jgi:hypothetical protein